VWQLLTLTLFSVNIVVERFTAAGDFSGMVGVNVRYSLPFLQQRRDKLI